MKTLFTKRLLALACAVLLSLSTLGVACAQATTQPYLGVSEVALLKVDDFEFKDLNKNGALDPYEDWRLSADERTADLLEQMTAEEKAAQMVHLTLVTLKETWFSELDIGFALAYNYLAEGPIEAATKTNEIQQLAESSRLGIPVVLSMDSVIGASWINGATILPDQLTLAAAGNVAAVKELANLQRKEMKALGIRMSLSPVADLATDPRWGRAQECYGEDVNMATDMVVASIEGLQAGNALSSDSVMACVKHFPGSGAQTAGVDGTPLVFDDQSFPMHLSIFEKAIAAGAAAIMPYGYSQVPYLGGDATENYAHESSTVMTELLRGKLGYTGIIQTDWGLNHVFAAQSGADILGGAGQREIGKLAEKLTAEILNDRVSRILKTKFQLGIFENPYTDVDTVGDYVGTQEHYNLVLNAACAAMTLVKYENAKPLEGQKIIVAGSLAEDHEALSSGWKIPEAAGQDILTAITKKAGKENVTFIGADATQVEASYPENTTAIVVVGEATGTHEPSWGTSTLTFPDEQLDMLTALHNAGVPVVTVVLMGRSYVMSEVVALSDSVMLAYRPGVTAGAEAIVKSLYGENAIAGKTPFQIPASADQVLLQREDLAKDIVDPLFDYGFGIEVASFGK